MVRLSERKWDYEQDLFIGKHKGYKYIVKRMPLGHLCGYVRLTKNDELFKTNLMDEDIYLRVHGGITYTSPGNPLDYFSESSKFFYIGFDTAHGGDVSPAMVDFLKDMPSYGTYKDLPYVRKQCKKLINQIKEDRK